MEDGKQSDEELSTPPEPVWEDRDPLPANFKFPKAGLQLAVVSLQLSREPDQELSRGLVGIPSSAAYWDTWAISRQFQIPGRQGDCTCMT